MTTEENKPRLSGKKIKLPKTGAKLDRVFTYTLESMEAATAAFRDSLEYRATLTDEERAATVQQFAPAMMTGNPATLPNILELAATLEVEAVDVDPRLASRPAWVRSIEGLDLDAGLYLAGEEACCLDRRRQKQNERQASGEPVRVVISTDTSAIPPEAAAAFVAAARLASQFVPLEIWWQGSWMLEEGPAKGLGHVFHVPLVRAGEMDFSRLQFVLCSPMRDSASFQIMFGQAFPAGLPWGGGRLEYSTLEGTTDFVPATGIRATAASVASRAATWAGMVSKYAAESNPETLQSWEPKKETRAETYTPTPEQTQRWEAQRVRDEREAAERAASRAGQMAMSF